MNGIPSEWPAANCIFCGHPFEVHLEPNSDSPVCMTCDAEPEGTPAHGWAWHAMGWPTEVVVRLMESKS